MSRSRLLHLQLSSTHRVAFISVTRTMRTICYLIVQLTVLQVVSVYGANCPLLRTTKAYISCKLTNGAGSVTCDVGEMSPTTEATVYCSSAPYNNHTLHCQENGHWHPAYSDDLCIATTCPPLKSDRLNFNCLILKGLSVQSLSCQENDLPIETTAFMTACHQPYIMTTPFYNYRINCQANGQWDPPLPEHFCSIPMCPSLQSSVLEIECRKDGVRTNCTHLESSRGTEARFSCNPETHEERSEPGYNSVTCEGTTWSQKLPEDHCQKKSLDRTCPPLLSVKMDIFCYLGKKPVSCDTAVAVGTEASFSCRSPAYKPANSLNYRRIVCRSSGRWNRILPENLCVAECGRALNPTVVASINSGKEVKHGEFPWHVALFEKVEVEGTRFWVNQCGGSIISNTVVITAAHCVAELDTAAKLKHKDPSLLVVGVGKFYRDIDEELDQDNAALHKVRALETPKWYKGITGNYQWDIALLFLKEPMQFGQFVAPVCLDVNPDTSFELEQLRPGGLGKVVGWGRNRQGSPSQKLLLANQPYVPLDVCMGKDDSYVRARLSPDKMCAGDDKSSVAVCKGDSGGGLVFYHSPKEAYYLRGIVSLGVQGCTGGSYSIFTKISTYAGDLAHVVNSDVEEPIPKNWIFTGPDGTSQWSEQDTFIDEELPKKPSLFSVKETCLPLVSTKLTITCSKDDSPAPCDKAMEDGTKAEFKCRCSSAVPRYSQVYCYEGAWTRPLPSCYSGGGDDCGEPSTLSAVQEPGQRSKDKCLEYSTRWQRTSDNTCGFKPGTISPDKEAGPLEFPHMARLGHRAQRTWQWKCSGSLISERYVLTTASCLSNERITHAQLDRDSPIHIKVTRQIPHQEYQAEGLRNDIALVQLGESVVFNSYMRPACLQVQRDTDEKMKSGVISSWDNQPRKRGALVQDNVTFLDNAQCDGNGFNRDSMICVAHQKGICLGESGAPLQIVLTNPQCMYNIVGLVSHINCERQQLIRVSHFVPWIENTLWPQFD